MKYLSFPVIETPDRYGFVPNDMLDPIETKIIITACMNRPHANVLEIGTCRGRTTANIARALMPAGGHLLSIDVLHKPDTLPCSQDGEVPGLEYQAGEEIPETYKDFVNLELIDPDDDNALVAICDKQIKKHGKFDVVFIDGDHSYKGVLRDWHVVARRLAIDGVALFHDVWWDEMPPPVEGPLKLMKELNGTVLNLSHTGAMWNETEKRFYI